MDVGIGTSIGIRLRERNDIRSHRIVTWRVYSLIYRMNEISTAGGRRKIIDYPSKQYHRMSMIYIIVARLFQTITHFIEKQLLYLNPIYL